MTTAAPYSAGALRDDLRHLLTEFRHIQMMRFHMEIRCPDDEFRPLAPAIHLHRAVGRLGDCLDGIMPLFEGITPEDVTIGLLAGRPPFVQGLLDLAAQLLPPPQHNNLTEEQSLGWVPGVYWHELKLKLAMTSRDHSELAYKLSLFPQTPSLDFLATAPSPLEVLQCHRGDSWWLGDVPSHIPRHAVLAWMLLNAPFNDHAPRLYAEECIWADLRNVLAPGYRHAIQHCFLAGEPKDPWELSQVFSLFHSHDHPYSYKLYQWLLQFGRDWLPDDDPQYHSRVYHFVDTFRTGRASALHVAAIMGLPSTCQQLIEVGYDANLQSPWGSPLYCALAGGANWTAIYKVSKPERSPIPGGYAAQRVDTVRCLLDAGASGSCAQPSAQGKGSLAGFGFTFTMREAKDEQILRKIVDGGARLDRSLAISIMDYPISELGRSFNEPLLARVLTYLHGVFLVREGAVTTDSSQLLSVIETVMATHGLVHDTGEYPDPVNTISSSPGPGFSARTFEGLVADAIGDNSIFHLRRLMLDPRFEFLLQNPGGEPFLHTAVMNDRLEVVELLLAAGADVECRDETSRTPVMVVESDKMLDLLVTRHGALTTATEDHGGRTIWHMVAATHDMALLDWLIRNDPHKAENMRAVSKKGRTPLAEALFMSPYQKHRDLAGETPKAALRLLQDNDVDAEMISGTTRPLTHLAAAWGDLDVINALARLGADFSAVDLEGRCAMQYVKLSASKKVIARLRELGAEARMDLAAKAELPVEIFRQTCPYDMVFSADSSFELIAGPGQLAMPDRGFVSLLTPEVVSFVDADGHNLLERYVRKVWTAEPGHTMDMLRSDGYTKDLVRFMHRRFLAGFELIAEVGGVKAYEVHRERCALYEFLDGATVDLTPLRYEPLSEQILDVVQVRGSLLYLAEFCLKDQDGIVTEMMDAMHFRKTWDLLGLPSKEGIVSPCEPDFAKIGVDGLILIMHRVSVAELETVLKLVDDNDDLRRNSCKIMDCFISSPRMEDPIVTFKILQEHGFEYDPEAEKGKENSLIRRMMMTGDTMFHSQDLVLHLLDMGADPRLTEHDITAARQVVIFNSPSLLAKLIRIYGPEFPWHQPTAPDSNLLMDAAKRASGSVIELLLTQTSAKQLVNTRVCGSTPLHWAAVRGGPGLDIVLCLRSHGADDMAVDEQGETWIEQLVGHPEADIADQVMEVASELCGSCFHQDLPYDEMKRLLEVSRSRRKAAVNDGGSMVE